MEELAGQGMRSLPGNLNDAVDLMETSDLVREALGDHVFAFFIRNKRQEWAEYKTQVSQFELDRYLPRL
jgi:glutamine synthetase